MSDNIKKGIRQTNEIISGILELYELDKIAIGSEKNSLKYAYRLLASDIKTAPENIKWDRIKEIKFNTNKGISYDQFGTNRTVILSKDDFDIVSKSFMKEHNELTRLHFSYLTKLVLLYALDKLRTKNNEIKNGKTDKFLLVKAFNRLNNRFIELLDYNTFEAEKMLIDIDELLSRWDL